MCCAPVAGRAARTASAGFRHPIDRRPADLEGLRDLRGAFALRLQFAHLGGIYRGRRRPLWPSLASNWRGEFRHWYREDPLSGVIQVEAASPAPCLLAPSPGAPAGGLAGGLPTRLLFGLAWWAASAVALALAPALVAPPWGWGLPAMSRKGLPPTTPNSMQSMRGPLQSVTGLRWRVHWHIEGVRSPAPTASARSTKHLEADRLLRSD
jgi:hypothetical protein